MSYYSLHVVSLLCVLFMCKKYGPLRELNPGPPAPEAGIMPLDQVATVTGIPIDPPYEGPTGKHLFYGTKFKYSSDKS